MAAYWCFQNQKWNFQNSQKTFAKLSFYSKTLRIRILNFQLKQNRIKKNVSCKYSEILYVFGNSLRKDLYSSHFMKVPSLPSGF